MANPLQGREMSAVTISVSVSCLPVSGSAAEQDLSLETSVKQLQRLKIPDPFWLRFHAISSHISAIRAADVANLLLSECKTNTG